MAIPEVMAYLGMAPAFASLDSDDTKPVLIDCYVRQDSQPVVLQAAIITEASVTPDFRGSLENYGMFHPLEDSSVPCEIFVRGGDVKPK